MSSAVRTEAACLKAAIAPKPFDLAGSLSDLAIGWAGRHGSLKATLYLLEIDLRYGDITSAQDRIAKALARDEVK